MPILDLHHLSHEEVVEKVIDFINFLEPPFKIITGKSDKMRELVCNVVEQYGWHYHDEYYQNYGCLVITEKEI